MNRAILLAVALAAGCTNERAIELAITASEEVPDDVVSWELRISEVERGTGVCPSAAESAGAARVGRLVHAQTFTDVGMAVGEIPEGRWTLAVLGRDASCAPRFYGCSAIDIGGETFSPIAIRVEPVVGLTELCGGCRSCDVGGGCSPVASTCD